MSFWVLTLRGSWCDINVQNIHAPTDDKTVKPKDSFYNELELTSLIFHLPFFHWDKQQQYYFISITKCIQNHRFQTTHH
jgi:hypothetical protein